MSKTFSNSLVRKTRKSTGRGGERAIERTELSVVEVAHGGVEGVLVAVVERVVVLGVHVRHHGSDVRHVSS